MTRYCDMVMLILKRRYEFWYSIIALHKLGAVVIPATDLDNGESHEFRSGPIVEAVTASCSIPIIFSPVVINGVHYVDGGLFHNFPVSIIREECERIIGVNVDRKSVV